MGSRAQVEFFIRVQCNDDELERIENRAYLTRRDLTCLEGTAEERGLLEFSWTSNPFLVVDPSKLAAGANPIQLRSNWQQARTSKAATR